ncbi:hypothetical protein NsoK4_04195 [Nitrosopumilus sp. K4]|uniref:hypothetical protein n=1 Tax=Nitrosopumilus sp. K4 TaxID=2795383 RepID=UPI001BA56AD3|nr:hypothetical protein [Nitrosopumilus sp. K4]QUC65452.1 hypothetical protein NsoK4_04195 [Nitrosopumilus sp. K4]
MNSNLVMRFNSVNELQSHINNKIKLLEEDIQEYSNILGEKIRMNNDSSKDDPEFLELKEKLESSSDSEKKKKPSKKKKNSQWYDLDGIFIYNGLGLNGELELYFKGIDELKSELESMEKTKKTLDMVIEKGLKEDMGCIVYLKNSGPLEIAFSKNAQTRKKFSFQTIYSAKPENNENLVKMENN